jgi:hypothetical protein
MMWGWIRLVWSSVRPALSAWPGLSRAIHPTGSHSTVFIGLAVAGSAVAADVLGLDLGPVRRSNPGQLAVSLPAVCVGSAGPAWLAQLGQRHDVGLETTM